MTVNNLMDILRKYPADVKIKFEALINEDEETWSTSLHLEEDSWGTGYTMVLKFEG